MVTDSVPAITVILPVYNAQRHLRDSLQSILNQQFTDFELLVIDDGSSDDSVEIINSFKDPRMKLEVNTKNKGLSWTLNKGLELATGRYIARMDADDISHPQRLYKQFKFMEKNTRVGVLGSWVRYFGKQIPIVEKVPCDSDIIKSYMVFDNPMFHPTVLMRKSLLNEFKLKYDETFHRSEDFHLWIRASKYFPLRNLPIPLLRYRCHELSITGSESSVMKDQVMQLLKGMLKKIDVSTDTQTLLFHYAVSKGERMESIAKLDNAEKWLSFLLTKNSSSQMSPQNSFAKAVSMVWNRLCLNSTHLGFAAFKKCVTSELSKGLEIPFDRHLRFFVSQLFRVLLKRNSSEK